jgi:hypothetical protein
MKCQKIYRLTIVGVCVCVRERERMGERVRERELLCVTECLCDIKNDREKESEKRHKE